DQPTLGDCNEPSKSTSDFMKALGASLRKSIGWNPDTIQKTYDICSKSIQSAVNALDQYKWMTATMIMASMVESTAALPDAFTECGKQVYHDNCDSTKWNWTAPGSVGVEATLGGV